MRKFVPRVPKFHVQSWLTADEYAAIEKVCLTKRLSMSQLVREGVVLAAKKHAEDMAA